MNYFVSLHLNRKKDMRIYNIYKVRGCGSAWVRKCVGAWLAWLLPLALSAQESQTAYNFLRLPVSAHAAALGGDNITLVEDEPALMFHNPALLSTVSDKTIGLNYMNYMEGVNTASASFNRIVKERASWATSGQFIDYGKMKETNEEGIQTGDFTARDIAMAGYFSYLLTNRIAGGIAARFISSTIGEYNSMAVGVDLGLNYFDPNRLWSVSVVAKNLGGQIKAYDEEYDRMPFDLQIGVSKQMQNMPVRFHLTLIDLNHWGYRFANHAVAGVDVMPTKQTWVAVGYNFRRAYEMKIASGSDESSHNAGLALGAGLNLERIKIAVSYGKYHVSSRSLMFNLGYTL